MMIAAARALNVIRSEGVEGNSSHDEPADGRRGGRASRMGNGPYRRSGSEVRKWKRM
jgi:hypothetical protein